MTERAADQAAAIEQLLGDLRGRLDGESWRAVDALVRAVVGLYGQGMRRVAETLAADAEGRRHLERLADDALVGSLLALHDVHPLSPEERVGRTLDGLRDRLAPASVRLVSVDVSAGVAVVSVDAGGGPVPQESLRRGLERAVLDAAPELTRVEVEGLAQTAAPIPVEALRRKLPRREAG